MNVIESLMSAEPAMQLAVHGGVLLYLLSLIIMFFIILSKTNSMQTLNSIPNFKKFTSFFYVLTMTCLQAPLIQIIMSAIFYGNRNGVEIELTNIDIIYSYITYVVAALNGILLIIVQFLLQKLFVVRIPSSKIPWAASSTQLHTMKFINKVAVNGCHLYITAVEGTIPRLSYIVSLAVLILLFGTALSRVLVIPHYHRSIEWIIRLGELLCSGLLLILAVCHILLTNHSTEDGVVEENFEQGLALLVALITFPMIIMFAFVMDFQRQKSLWSKLERGQIKHEIEFEYALYIMVEKMNLAMFASPTSVSGVMAFADILYLADVHRRNCVRQQCACDKLQLVQYILNKGYTYDEKKLILNDDEITLLNASCRDGFVQSDKKPTSAKTLTLLQNYNFYQVSRMVDYRDTGNNNQNPKSSPPKKKIKFSQQDHNNDNENHQEAYEISINIAKLKLTFLNQFAEIFFDEARKKFPQSKRIFFQYTYFTLHFCRNKFMTESLLRNFESTCLRESRNPLDLAGVGRQDFGGQAKNGWIEHVSVLINELQTVMDVEKIDEYRVGSRDDDLNLADTSHWGINYLKNGRQVTDITNTTGSAYQPLNYFDPEYFILMNELSGKFYEQIERMAYFVQTFWKMVQSENFDVENTFKQGRHLADNIALVYKSYQEIDSASEYKALSSSSMSGGSGSGGSGPSGSKNFDFRILYSFAQVQRLLLNDMSQHDIMFQKIEAQKDILNLIQNNKLQSLRGPGDTGFFIARVDDRNFGKIILANQFFRKKLGYTSKDLKHKNIKDLQPEMIQNWHNKFVSDFTRTGGAYNGILGKTSCIFIKKKNGYVTPAMINVRFHYSKDYDFTFICFASILSEIQIQRGAGANKTPIDDVLFFLVEDTDGRVVDFSESCEKQIGLSLQNVANGELETKYQWLSIEDLVPSLTHQRIQDLGVKGELYQQLSSIGTRDSSQNFEEMIDIDTNIVHALKSSGGHQYYNNYSYMNRPKYQKALCQVFKECYGQEKDKIMNIVAIVLVDQIAIKEYQQVQNKERHNKKKQNKKQKQQKRVDFRDQASLESAPQENWKNFGSKKESSEAMGTTIGVSNIEVTTLKQLYQSTEQLSSTSLKLVTQLMMMVFILLLTVSAINLVLSMKQNNALQSEVYTVKLSYDRQARHVQIRSLLRGMINMANGYETLESSLDKNRFKMYMDAFNQQILSLKETHDTVEKDDFEYSDSFKKMLEDKIIALEYLDPYNVPSIEFQSYSYALNLFIQRASSVTNWGIDRFKGNIRQIKIQNPPMNYKPTDEERLLYFLIKACQNKLRSQGNVISTQFRNETDDHALNVASKTEITIIVSIVSIILVTLIISPIICRIQERQYMGLKFFLNIDSAHLQILDDQVSEFLQLTFADSSVHTGITHQEAMVLDEKTKMQLQQLGDNQLFVDPYERNPNQNQEETSSESAAEDSEIVFVCRSIDEEFMTNSMGSNQQDEHGFVANRIPQILFKKLGGSGLTNNTANFGNNSIDELVKSKKKDQKQAQNPQQTKINEANDLVNTKKNVEDAKKQSQDESNEKDETASEENRKIDMKEQKMTKINKTVYRQKASTVFLVISLALCFCSYFVAGYFFSVNSFAKTPSILQDLDSTYFQDITIDSLMTFIREDYLYNQSVPTTDVSNQSGSEYFLNLNQDRVQNFIRIRKNMPAVFAEIESYFQAIETEKLCEVSFVGRETEKDRCLNIYNGVLRKGLTYSINVILSHFRNLNLKFDTNKNRNMEFILNALADQDTIELIEMQQFVMNEIYLTLKEKVTESTTNYYNRLITQYQGLFSAFIALMTILFAIYLIFGYSRIKDSMWRTNMMLKIMPIELLPRESITEMKSFFKY